MATVSDDFNRSNSTSLGSNWAEDSGNWVIVSNTLRQSTSSGAYRKARWVGSALASSDYAVQAVCSSSNGAVGPGVFGRGAASSTVTYYGLVFFPGDNIYIVEITAGSESVLASGSGFTPSSGVAYTLRLECEGTALRGYVNGTLRVSGSDSTLASGAVGVMSYGGSSDNNSFDDWTASDLSSGSIYSATASAGAASSTPDAVGLDVVRAAAALASASSGTPDTVTLQTAIVVDATASAGASSVTPDDVGVSVVRGATAASPAVSGTPDTVTLDVATIWSATASALAASVTPVSVALDVVRSSTSSASAVSASPDSVTLGLVLAVSAQAGASSATGGGAGLRFYGYADDRLNRVVIPLQGEVINVGAGDLTFEWTMQCAYADNDNTASDVRYSNILIDHDVWGEEQGWCIGITRSGAESRLIFGAASSSWAAITGGTHVGDGQVHRCALTRNQSTGQVRLWVDGQIDATGTFATSDWSIPAGSPPVDGQDNYSLVLGTEKHDFIPGDGGYNGLLDELRISSGVRYTSAYTPAERLEVDGTTLGLYHMDEGSGTTISDATGDGPDGTLLVGGSPAGPVWVGASVRLNVVRGAGALAAAASLTGDDAALAVVRLALALAGANSLTPDSVTLDVATIVQALASAGAASVTPDTVSVDVVRLALAQASAAGATGDDVALGLALAAVASATAGSVTADDAVLAAVRGASASVIGAGATPDTVTLAVLRLAVSLSGAASVTPDTVTLEITAIIEAVAAAGATSVTGDDAALAVVRAEAALASASGVTGDAAGLAVLRAVTALAGAVSATPDTVTLDVTAVINAIAAAGAASVTGEAALAVVRAAAAAAVGDSATPDALLAVVRSVGVLAAAGSVTPDTVVLEITSILLALASAGAVSVTGDAALDVVRSAAAQAGAESATADGSLAVVRMALAQAEAESATPDTINLVLALIAGLLRATWTARRPSMTASGARPEARFTATRPSVTFTMED